MALSRINPYRWAGALVLSAAVATGLGGTQAQNKNAPVPPVKNLDGGKLNQDGDLEHLFKKVEGLNPGSKERKEILEVLKQTAISQSSAPDKNKIGKRLVEIMNKDRRSENWSELSIAVLEIMKRQAFANKAYWRPGDDIEKVSFMHLDREMVKDFSKVLLSAFDDSKIELKGIQKEAKKNLKLLINEPFDRSELAVPWYIKQVKLLSELPRERAGEIKEGLLELHEVYSARFVSIWAIERELSDKSRFYLEGIFRNNLNLLLSESLDKQKAGVDNLDMLCQQLPVSIFGSGCMQQLLVNTKRDSDKFFNEDLKKLEARENSAESLKTIIKGCFALIDLAGHKREYHETFIEFLGQEVEKTTDPNNEKKSSKENKGKQKVLEVAFRDELEEIVKKVSNHLELARKLAHPYAKLIAENNANLEFLQNGLRTYQRFKSYCGDDELNCTGLILLDSAVEGISSLPLKEQKELKAYILRLVRNYYVQDDFLTEQSLVVDRLSKLFCREQDPENFSELVKSFFEIGPKDHLNVKNLMRLVPGTKWHSYSLFKLINDNREYFEDRVISLVKVSKTSKDEKERIRARDIILQTYRTFQHVTKEGSSAKIYFQNTLPYWNVEEKAVDKLEKEVKKYFNEKLERPMFSAILYALENEKAKVVRTDIQTNIGVRFIDNESWKNFNGRLSTIVFLNPKLRKEVIPVLIKRLENDSDPYNRQMIYDLLSHLYNHGDFYYYLEQRFNHQNPLTKADKKNEWADNSKIVSLMKDRFAKESPQAAHTIGTALLDGPYTSILIDSLTDHKILEKVKIDKESPVYRFNLDLVSILYGDRKLSKSYLPKDLSEGNKEAALKTLKAAQRLRENAFHSLSGVHYQGFVPGNLINFLESKLEKTGTPETLPPIWGRQAASLITFYREHEIDIDSKLDFLKGRFFDGIEKVGENETYTITPLFNLSLESEFIRLNSENSKILQELGKQKKTPKAIRDEVLRIAPKLGEHYKEMRQAFALNMLTLLCERDHTKYEEYLRYLDRIMGFTEGEEERLKATFLNLKI